MSEFIIPLLKDDLLKKSKDQYYVHDVWDISECIRQSSIFRRDLKTKGAEAVLQHFDVAFSYLNTPDVSFSQLQDFYDQTISNLLQGLCPYVEDACGRVNSKDDKLTAVNVIRMTIYLFSLFLKTYEEKLAFGRENFISEPKQKKSRTKTKKHEEMWPWSDIKNEAFTVLYSFLKTPFDKLWLTTTVEDQFINLIANCCYKTFENPEINLVKMKSLRVSSSQVLGLLVRNFNHQLTFVPKAIQLMKQHESAGVALSNAVITMISEYNCDTLLHKMIIELFDEMLDDSQILGRAAGTFILDVAESKPSLLISSVLELEQFFSVEAYPVRIAVLVAYTEILCHFSNDDLTTETKKLRDKMLWAMEKEIHDENAYVRSKVLQLWTKLLINNKIPIENYLNILCEIKFKIMDKSTQVSKNAIIFFKNVLSHNPYAGKFQLNEAQTLVEKTREELKKITKISPLPPEEMWKMMELKLTYEISTILEKEGDIVPERAGEDEVPLGHVIFIIGLALKEQMFSNALNILKTAHVEYPDAKEIRVGLDPENKVEYYTKTLEKIFLNSAEMYPEDIVPEYYSNKQKIDDCHIKLKYLESHVGFVQCMGEVMVEARQIMSLREGGADSVEAVLLLREGAKFRVQQCDAAIRDMIHLINSERPDLRQAVTQTYASLYLESNKPTPHARAQQVVKRLVKLVQEMDFGQKSALEQVIAAWLESNELDRNFISVLLEKVKLSDVTVKEKSAILVILGMIAKQNPSLVSGNLQLFTSLLNKDQGSLLVQLTCDIIACQANVSHGGKHIRYRAKNPMFQNSIDFLLQKFEDHKCYNFENLACSVITMITKLCLKPEELCYELLSKLHQKTLPSSSVNKSTEEVASPDITEERFEESKVNKICLSRLIHVGADVAYKLWFYFYKTVYNALKKKSEGHNKNETPKDEENELAMEMDNEVAAEEAFHKEVSESFENWLNNPDFLFYHLREKAVKICYNFANQSNDFLIATAAVALAKFMYCSSSFCQQHFQLFATLIDKSQDERTRSSLALSFSDLIFLYPNVAEPWTPYLFARLKDPSSLVRRSTVSVLSHLVCREMVKVRGQAADMLLHLEDPDRFVSGKIRSLMVDISKKGNTLYNVVPDIISNLSNPERQEPVLLGLFKFAVEFVLGLLNPRQKESLVERLCLRIKEASCEEQQERLSHCLSLLSYGTERSLGSLIDSLPAMKDALNNPAVLSTIESILTTQTKSNKPNIKELAGEGMDKLEELTGITGKESQHAKKVSTEATNSADEAAPTAPPPSTRKKRARRKRYVQSSDEE